MGSEDPRAYQRFKNWVRPRRGFTQLNPQTTGFFPSGGRLWSAGFCRFWEGAMARREWVRVMEAAKIIGHDPTTVYRLEWQGHVRVRRAPRKPREFSRTDLERWLAAQGQPQEAST